MRLTAARLTMFGLATGLVAGLAACYEDAPRSGPLARIADSLAPPSAMQRCVTPSIRLPRQPRHRNCLYQGTDTVLVDVGLPAASSASSNCSHRTRKHCASSIAAVAGGSRYSVGPTTRVRTPTVASSFTGGQTLFVSACIDRATTATCSSAMSCPSTLVDVRSVPCNGMIPVEEDTWQ